MKTTDFDRCGYAAPSPAGPLVAPLATEATGGGRGMGSHEGGNGQVSERNRSARRKSVSSSMSMERSRGMAWMYGLGV